MFDLPRKGNREIRDEEKFEGNSKLNKQKRREKKKDWEELRKDKNSD